MSEYRHLWQHGSSSRSLSQVKWARHKKAHATWSYSYAEYTGIDIFETE
jgi:hypothetical protein